MSHLQVNCHVEVGRKKKKQEAIAQRETPKHEKVVEKDSSMKIKTTSIPI